MRTPLVPRGGDRPVHRRGQLADPARGPLAPVLVPHVADDDGRLRGLPRNTLVRDDECVLGRAFRCSGRRDAHVQHKWLVRLAFRAFLPLDRSGQSQTDGPDQQTSTTALYLAHGETFLFERTACSFV